MFFPLSEKDRKSLNASERFKSHYISLDIIAYATVLRPNKMQHVERGSFHCLQLHCLHSLNGQCAGHTMALCGCNSIL